MWNRNSNLSYNWYLVFVNVVIPCLGIIFCYSRIYVFTQNSKNRSNNLSVNRSIHLAKTFFASFMVFAICWMPYGLVVLIDFDYKVPRSLVLYSDALGILHSSLNPIIYLVFNSNFRIACGHLFNKICCCVKFLNLRNNTVSASVNHLSTIANNVNTLQKRALYNN